MNMILNILFYKYFIIQDMMQNCQAFIDQALKTVLLPGKGIYLMDNNQQYKHIESKYTGLVFKDLNQFSSEQKINPQTLQNHFPGVNFDSRTIQNKSWNQAWNSDYLQKVQYSIKAVRIIVDEKTIWNSKYLSFIKNLSKASFWVVVAIYLSEDTKKNIQKYQEYLARISQQLIKLPSYMHAGLTIQLEFLDSSIQAFDRKSLCIWRRVVPITMASISVRDPIPNAMFNIHYFDGITVDWKLHFTSKDMNKFQKYVFESLGVQQMW